MGHIQQGGSPSGLDRIYATQMSAAVVNYIEQQRQLETPTSACVGVLEGKVSLFPFEKMFEDMDLKGRRSKNTWWKEVIPYVYAVTSCDH